MANRTDKFPPGLCRIPETVRMKRKKLQEPFSKIKKVAGRSEKNGDRRFALAPLRFRRSTNRKSSNWPVNGSARVRVTVVRLVGPDCTPRLGPQDSIDRSAIIAGAGESAL